MRVSVPGSSANLGAGFDALGLAVDLPFVLAVDESDASLLPCEPTHPAAVAFRNAGGSDNELRWRSRIPPGRGLGFSGAAHVAGALAAAVLSVGEDGEAARRIALEVATDLEGHPENAAASLIGGFVVAAGSRVVPVPIGTPFELVAWWPSTTTSTASARAALNESVSFDDAVFNVGRAALMVAAITAGDLEALTTAAADRLHTAQRLALQPASAQALAAFEGAGHAAWLSGSGPTVVAVTTPGDGVDLITTVDLPPGDCRVLEIDLIGAWVSENP